MLATFQQIDVPEDLATLFLTLGTCVTSQTIWREPLVNNLVTKYSVWSFVSENVITINCESFNIKNLSHSSRKNWDADI